MTYIAGNEHNLIFAFWKEVKPHGRQLQCIIQMEDNLNVLVNWKTTSIFRQMEEALNYLCIWKTTSFFPFTLKRTSIFWLIEDEHTFLLMEEELSFEYSKLELSLTQLSPSFLLFSYKMSFQEVNIFCTQCVCACGD